MISTPIKCIMTACLPLACTVMLGGEGAIATPPQHPLVTPAPTAQSSQSSLQQGKAHLDAGQYTAAVDALQAAVRTYQAQQARIPHIQALNYLAAAYHELGAWQEAQQALSNSFDLMPKARKVKPTFLLLHGQALTQQGKLQLALGQAETAYETWQQATERYQQVDDDTGQIITAINQAQALEATGKYRQARTQLEALVQHLEQQPDSLLKARGLRSLGIALQTTGDLLQSKAILEKSLAISQQFNSPQDTSAAYFSIGNVAKDLGEDAVAWTYYQEAIQLAPALLTRVQAQLNQLSILIQEQRWQPVVDLVPAIAQNLAQLPTSRSQIYSQVNLAQQLMTAQYGSNPVPADVSLHNSASDISQLLVTSVQQARQIQDPRAEAFTLKQLGKLYQRLSQHPDARTVTEKALQIAQEINADDITARSAAQLGQIRTRQGDVGGAIAAYDIAFTKLQRLRSDLVTVNADVQFSFKDSIESTYREYVSLLLTQDTQDNLKKARQVIDALQLAELDNFFRDACVDSHPVVLDDIDTQAAVIYPIILKDRLEVILALPNGQPLRHYATHLPPDQIQATLNTYYSSFSPGYPRDIGLDAAQEIYQWLIAPAAPELERNKIGTLVFVPDGFLRNLPMSALHNGQQYLIENFGIAISPGLQLFPEGLKGKELSLLVMGLTEARQGFTPLPGVEKEVQQISENIDAQVFLDQQFSSKSFQTALDQRAYPVVHLATHGQFSSNPDETFLLTWNDRIPIQQFDQLFLKRKLGLLQPIELLVMSACQTAAGDDRAALGLAGFALRSGARSTIASLWAVNDEATSILMRELYAQLSLGNISKAEALRRAQLKVLSDPLNRHPNFWAAFVLVGNWL